MAAPETQPRDPAGAGDEAVLRPPRVADGAAVWRLVRDSGALDLNSPYAYLLWCDRFAATSVVAEVGGEVAGFVLGFRPPGQSDTLFVWQVGVAPAQRGRGLALSMLDHLLAREPALRRVEATVTPSNAPSQRLFRALARRHGCPCEEVPGYAAADFPGGDHEPETLFRIGPLDPTETPS